jgi:hypothetical protein
LVDDPLAPVHAWLVAAKRLHVSAIQRAGICGSETGDDNAPKMSQDFGTDETAAVHADFMVELRGCSTGNEDL